MEYLITQMNESHIDDICLVENESFSIPWSKASFLEELKNPVAVYFTAQAEGRAIGYIGLWEVYGQADITNIAVLPAYRKKGIASALLKRAVSHCKSRGLSPITLEVRKSNHAALNLYSKFGFKTIGERKRYYADNGEDALIMACDII